uniref:Uncharacterized protein n=1 Tax=viral metagenome TaxID=1070528 RepID=A0A6M3JTB5_9ZZZZ
MFKADWIIAHDSTDSYPYMLECLRCGAIQMFKIPILVDYWVAVAKAFEAAHRKCRQEEIERNVQSVNSIHWDD